MFSSMCSKIILEMDFNFGNKKKNERVMSDGYEALKKFNVSSKLLMKNIKN